LPTEIHETLLLEVHRVVEAVAKEAVLKVGQPVDVAARLPGATPLAHSVAEARAALVTYPPQDAGEANGNQLSSAESAAIASLVLSPAARAGLEKLFADAAAGAFFRFFCLLDGVADPQVRPVAAWVGARLAEPQPDEDGPMLHDELFESYWRYRELAGPRR